MKEIPCPRCNSHQRFGRQIRELQDGQIEVYVRCMKCRWKKVVTTGYSDILSNERDIERLRIRALREPELRKVIHRKHKRNEHLAQKRTNS